MSVNRTVKIPVVAEGTFRGRRHMRRLTNKHTLGLGKMPGRK